MAIDDIVTLGFLVLLQAVLGFDNLLYISLESKRAPKEHQTRVRKLGIGLAIFLRIGLLFLLINMIKYVDKALFSLDLLGWIVGDFTLQGLIFLLGGAFILYTAIKEIWHMLHLEAELAGQAKAPKSPGQVIAMIVLMNLVFSFDSILSAMAVTDTLWVMAGAIIIGGLMMMWLADRVATFLAKNRMYEVLGLFILLIVGVMLLSEGGEKSALHLFGSPVTHMSKTTFYFAISVLVLTDMVQSRYQRNLSQRVMAQSKP